MHVADASEPRPGPVLHGRERSRAGPHGGSGENGRPGGGRGPARACPNRSGYGGRLRERPAVVGETGGHLARTPASDASRETTATSTETFVAGGGCAPENPG
jgi:hypothetical protein